MLGFAVQSTMRHPFCTVAIMNERNVHQIVRDQLTQQPAATSFQALRRVASQETYAGSCVRRLANQVGGLHVLETLDTNPLPEEAFDWSVVSEPDREFVESVLDSLDRVGGRLFDIEYTTIARRLLARVLATDVGPVRRSSSPNRIAAGLMCAALSGNLALGRRNGRWTATDIGTFFGTSTPTDVAHNLVRAAQFEEAFTDDNAYRSYQDPVQLRSPAFLHSRMRQNLIQQRIAAVALAEDEERKRANRRPIVNLGNGRLAIKSCPADIAIVNKGIGPSGVVMVMIGFAPLTPDPELEVFALSVSDATQLVAQLQNTLAAPAPRRDLFSIN
jgi:hypothetical protein